ncbi:MAG TPA: PAS domain S-box protein [Terriglobia bacterium]|nr:PAS domain S-box protein [Terriglobia bacterium]
MVATTVLLLAMVVVGLIWLHLRATYQDTLDYWASNLSSSADEQINVGNLWLIERRTDTEGLAGRSEVVHLLLTKATGGNIAEIRQQALRYVQHLAAINGFRGGAIADTGCGIVAETGVPEDAMAGVQSVCREAQAFREFSVGVYSLQTPHVWLNLAFPVPAVGTSPLQNQESRRGLGVVIMIAEPWESVFRFLWVGNGPSQPASTVIVWKGEGGTVALGFSPHLSNEHRRRVVRLPLSGPAFESRVAREGNVGFGEFTDQQGVRVFGVAKPIPLADASLIRKVDRDKALAEFHKRALLEGLVGALCILLFGCVIVAQHRVEATQNLKDKLRQQQALLDLKRHVEVSEERFRELVESVDAIVWEEDAATSRVTFVSQGAERILGLSPREWLETPNFWADHLHPEDRDRARRCEHETLESAEALWVEYRMGTSDGGFRWFRDFMHVVKGRDGKARLLRGIMVDITENKEAEEALRQSDKRYKDFISHSMEGVWRIEAEPPIPIDLPEDQVLERLLHNCYLAECNLAYVRTLGLPSLGDALGRSVREVLPLLDSDRERLGSLRSAIRGGFQTRNTEFRGLDRAGSFRDLVSTEIPIVKNGLLVRIWGITRDVTERKQAEKALRESEERFRTTFETAGIGMAVVDIQGHPLQCNPALERMLGYTEEELLRMSFTEFTYPEDQEMNLQLYRELIAGTRDSYQIEKRYIRKDGQVVWGFLTVSLVKDAQGRPQYAVGMAEDITERKRAEEALRNLNAELEERVIERTQQLNLTNRELEVRNNELSASNQELEAFSYSVAHDLRAPLRQIQGFSHLLQEGHSPDLAPEAHKYIGTIIEGAQHMGRLIDHLLDLSRLGRRALRLEARSLAILVEDARRDLAGEIDGRDVCWQVGDLPQVECDAALMRQVFVNLISNALKYTQQRQPAVIEIGQAKVGDVLAVFVKDNGAGFNMKYADKLFGVFHRLHRREDFEGTGIGLATVKRIIEKHGGRIWAEAEVGKGATFYFTLAGRPESAPQDESPLTATQKPG